MTKISADDANKLLQQAVDEMPHEPCLTCECFLGLVAQLQVDTEPAGKEALQRYRVARSEMHRCLGCDPCPPGDRYAEYVRAKKGPNLITL